jgi:hypothetical protein
MPFLAAPRGFEMAPRQDQIEASILLGFLSTPRDLETYSMETVLQERRDLRLEMLRKFADAAKQVDQLYLPKVAEEMGLAALENRLAILQRAMVEHPRQVPDYALYGKYRAVEVDTGLPSNPVKIYVPGMIEGRDCRVNGFNPAWGAPPSTYLGIPLQFDPSMGAYRFDRAFAIEKGKRPSGQATFLESDLTTLEVMYKSKHMLQPFKEEGQSEWEFRRLPARREEVCT